jgi:alginate O-acetyltransferase complex protein AlgI
VFTLLSYALAIIFVIAGTIIRRGTLRQLLWLAASYALYSTFGGRFLAVLAVSSVFNFIYGAFLHRNPTLLRLWGGIGANIGLLGFYKTAHLLAWIAGANSVTSKFLGGIAMPLGISFWTFQAMSYLFDLYRQEDLDPSLLEFCLYMAFWPTVIMGPICRLEKMLPQFRDVDGFSSSNLLAGVKRIVTGLFMKLVLSQILLSGVTPGAGVAAGFDGGTAVSSGLDVWFLAIGFGLQLFFDFAGYSNIVIGAAQLFGFRLVENFDSPFLALTPSEFWTRWHMSLSSWIRDYVFLPVAAARREVWWRYLALLFSMTLFGLWHGTNILFVLWGVYHGVLLIAHRVIQQHRRQLEWALPGSLESCVSWAVSFLAISLGWVLFRANSLGQVLTLLKAVVTPRHYLSAALPTNYYLMVLVALVGYLAYHIIFMSSLNKVRSAVTPEFKRGLAHWGLTTEFGSVVWLIPMAALLFLGMLIVHSGSEGVTPFVYALF